MGNRTAAAIAILMLTCLLVAQLGCNPDREDASSVALTASQPATRPSRTLFKGVELYSWQIAGDESWHFALLPGTNRQPKWMSEILAPAVRITGVDALKTRLREYAPTEHVFWEPEVANQTVPANIRFGLPEEAMVKDVEDCCRSLNITLHVTR